MIITDIGSEPVRDLRLASEITDKLAKHYPGHLWGVEFREDAGIVNIVCESVQSSLHTNMLYGYTLYMQTVYADPDLRCVVRAGGEILERASLDRGCKKEGDVVASVDGVAKKHQPRN